MHEYKECVKPVMEELNKKFKHLTQINDDCWLIQSNKDSMMEAYYVHTTPNSYIILSGDYGGLMLKVYGAETRLPNWMANATTLNYFTEKVWYANDAQQTKKYSQVKAEEILAEIKEQLLEDEEDLKKIQTEQRFDDLCDCFDLEMEHEYWQLIQDIETNFGLFDLCEYDPTEYTDRIKWQHKLLIFWANKVLDGAFTKQ